MRVAVAFTGPSNSGKTTVIEKIVDRLHPNKRVLVIKNDPKDKAVFDTKGKDSYRFYKKGADVAVVSPSRTTLFFHTPMRLERICELFDFDLLLVEGLKTLNLPRIGVFRNEIDPDYIPYVSAVAIEESVDTEILPENIDILNLNDTDQIIQWIYNHGKKV